LSLWQWVFLLAKIRKSPIFVCLPLVDEEYKIRMAGSFYYYPELEWAKFNGNVFTLCF